MELSSLSSMMKWMQLHFITLLRQLYFNNVIVLQSTKEGCSWLRKIKIIETAAMLINSDVLAVTSGGSFYPSSVDMFSTALIYLSNTWRLLLWTMDAGACSNKQHLLSQSWCSAWEHRLCSILCILTLFSATSHSYHFDSRFLLTTWSQILQLLQTGAEIRAELRSCPAGWVHTVCCWWCWPKHKFTGCLNAWNEMGHTANIHWVGPQPGESYTELWKWMTYKVLATFRSAFSLHFLWG